MNSNQSDKTRNRKEALLEAARFLMMLSENDALFTYPILENKDLSVSEKKEIGLNFDRFAELIDGNIQWKVNAAQKEHNLTGLPHYSHSFHALSPNDAIAKIHVYHENGRWYYSVDASQLTSGYSRGSQLVTMLCNFTFNTGGFFEGDRFETEEEGNAAGYTEMGEKRAFELMLSSALRFQTTQHLAPSKHLLSVLKKEGHIWKDVTNSQLTKQEIAGRNLDNISYLIDITYKNILSAIPEITGFRYSFHKNQFEREDKNGKWKAVKGKDFPVRADSEKRAEAQGAGRSTLARAVLVQSLIHASQNTAMVS